jgi:2-hydroxychromene-2-carboxylate isomerase
MAQIIDFSARRAAPSGAERARRARVKRGPGSPSPAPTFFFDLACPFSYLAAERVERALGAVEWVPVPGSALADGASLGPDNTEFRLAAELRAAELRLPLVWPASYPSPIPWAMRAAAYAAEAGAGSSFALAAARMAFCGGYNLDDPRVLAEVAAVSGLAPETCRAAAVDPRRDHALHATANGLRLYGVRALPTIRLGGGFRPAEAVFAERVLAPPVSGGSVPAA